MALVDLARTKDQPSHWFAKAAKKTGSERCTSSPSYSVSVSWPNE
jgi:hypothetical protein